MIQDSSRTSSSTEDIARRAYDLWEKEGRPDGKDLDYWLRAEAEFYKPAPATPTQPAVPKAPASQAKAPAKPRTRRTTTTNDSSAAPAKAPKASPKRSRKSA